MKSKPMCEPMNLVLSSYAYMDTNNQNKGTIKWKNAKLKRKSQDSDPFQIPDSWLNTWCMYTRPQELPLADLGAWLMPDFLI